MAAWSFTALAIDLVWVTGPDSAPCSYVAQLGLLGPVQTTHICDSTVLRITARSWTPAAGVPMPPTFIGGVLACDRGGNLDLVAATFPGMHYTLTESADRVTAAFSHRSILHRSMPTSLHSLKVCFRFTEPRNTPMEQLANKFMADLFVRSNIERRSSYAAVYTIEHTLHFTPDTPWEFAAIELPESVAAVELVYMSDTPGIFCRIHEDIATAFAAMDVCHSQDGPRITVSLSRDDVATEWPSSDEHSCLVAKARLFI